MLLAAHIIENEREKARADVFKEGIEKGVKECRAKAYADANRQNDAYYRRMWAALEAGEPFDEPPPMFGRNGR